MKEVTSNHLEKKHLIGNKSDNSKGNLKQTRFKNVFLSGSAAFMAFRLVASNRVDAAPITDLSAGNSKGLAQEPYSGWDHGNKVESTDVSSQTSSFLENFLQDLRRRSSSMHSDNSISQQFKDSSGQSDSKKVTGSCRMRRRRIEHFGMESQPNELNKLKAD